MQLPLVCSRCNTHIWYLPDREVESYWRKDVLLVDREDYFETQELWECPRCYGWGRWGTQ